MRFLLFIYLFAACNPVKQVMRDPAKVQDVVDAYLLKFPIVSDTVVKVDTVVGQTILLPGQLQVDTIFVKGDTVRGRTIIKAKTDTIVKPKYFNVTRTITDNKFKAELQKKNIAQAVVIDHLRSEVKDLKVWRVIMIGLSILLFILVVLWFLKRFKVIR